MSKMLDPQKVVALQNQDLATIREEIASSCQYLGHALGFPVELLVVDSNNAVFLAENSLVTAEYTITEDEQIVYDNITVHEDCGDPTKLVKTEELVEAIMNEDLEAADRAWPTFESTHITDFLSRQRLEQISESISFDNPAQIGIRSVDISQSINASRSYFRTENFTCLDKLKAFQEKVQEAIDEAIDSEETLGEVSYYTARGGRKTPKRVKVDRKKRRLSKKYARKNRAALIRRLKKARKKLKKMFRKPAFRRRMARVRRLNDAREIEQMRTLLRETISEEPNIAFLTIPEIAEQVEEAFKMEGVKGYTDQTVQETAIALAMVARRYYPEARKYITEAALSFLPASYDTPSDDPFESLEHINQVLWEKSDEQESVKEEIIKNVHELVTSLVDTLSDDLENANEDEEETKEIKSVLEKLQGYRDDLAGFDENPEDANLEKVKTILDYIAGLMDVEDEDEDDEGSDDPKPDDSSDDDPEEDDDDDDDDDDTSSEKSEEMKKEGTGQGQMVGDEHDSIFYGDNNGKSAKKPGFLPGGVKTKNEGNCNKEEEMGCSSDKKSKKSQKMSYKMGYKEPGAKNESTAVKTPSANKVNNTQDADKDPEFYGAGGKVNSAAQKKDTSEAPYNESLAVKLFGGASHPKTKTHGEYSDHPVSEDLDRNPLLEGYSMTRKASQTLKDLMKALGNEKEPGLGSNEWKRGKDTYFYELETEDQEDSGIKGEVIKGSKSIGSFHIDGDGYIVKFPGASTATISKVNKDKKRKLEESIVFFEEEEVYVPEKARDAVKQWANKVGAVVRFDGKTGKTKIPNQHMQAFKANFGN